MRYIKSMTQQKLSFLLAIYIGLFMNCAVFFRRFSGYAHDFTVWKGLSAVVELAGTVLVTFFLLRLLSLFGRRAAGPGNLFGAVFCRRQLLYDLPERGNWLRYYRLRNDHGY